MNEQLRPLTLAEILDRTAQLYRSRFLVFVGVSTIPAGTVFVFAAAAFAFTAWVGSNSRNGGVASDVLVWSFLALLSLVAVPIWLVISAWGAAAMSEASARIYLGDPVTIRGAYKNTRKRIWRYLGLYTLQGLVVLGIPAAVFSLGVIVLVASKVSGISANDSSPLAGGLMFLMLVVLGALAVWMLLRLCLSFPASVVEQATAVSALKRGVALSQGSRSRIFVLYLLGLVLNWVLTWGITFFELIVIALIPAFQGQKHSQAMGMIVLFSMYGSYFAVKALTKPIIGLALTIFYFDQRIRKEAFDIEWMMQQAGMVSQPAEAVPSQEGVVMPASGSPQRPEPPFAVTAEGEVPHNLVTGEVGMSAATQEGKA
jgi:hypothetical protein